MSRRQLLNFLTGAAIAATATAALYPAAKFFVPPAEGTSLMPDNMSRNASK
jgi:cytochrome b6-f complex iron-sulfur subunit